MYYTIFLIKIVCHFTPWNSVYKPEDQWSWAAHLSTWCIVKNYLRPLGQTSILDILEASFTHSVDCIYLLWDAILSEKSIIFFFFFPHTKPCATKSDQELIGQGQPRVIIPTNYDRPESHMLHTKIQDNQPTGSTEEDFKGVFTLYMYRHSSHLCHVTKWTE